MALSIAITDPDQTIIDESKDNISPKQERIVYEEIFTGANTIEKVIVVDRRRNHGLQILGNGTDTFSIWTTISAGVGNDDILDAAVPWIKIETAITVYQSVGGEINKGLLAIRIETVSKAAKMEVTCTESPDDE